MIALTKLRQVLSPSKASSFTSDEFLDIHRHLEGYLKRVLLIGLRLKGIKYDNSRKIIDVVHMDISSTIEKCWYLLDRSGSRHSVYITRLETNYPDLFLLKEQFIKFSSRYRNRLAHGLIDKLQDQNLIDLLCHVNISFHTEMERVFKAEFSHSAYEQPRDWGAARGTNGSIVDTMNTLNLGSPGPAPVSMSSVKSALSGTSYPKP